MKELYDYIEDFKHNFFKKTEELKKRLDRDTNPEEEELFNNIEKLESNIQFLETQFLEQ